MGKATVCPTVFRATSAASFVLDNCLKEYPLFKFACCFDLRCQSKIPLAWHNKDDSASVIRRSEHISRQALTAGCSEGEVEGEGAMLSAQRWDHRMKED